MLIIMFFSQIIAAAIGASFHIVVGISLAYSAILIPQLQEEGNRNSTTNSFHITENQGSWIGKLFLSTSKHTILIRHLNSLSSSIYV